MVHRDELDDRITRIGGHVVRCAGRIGIIGPSHGAEFDRLQLAVGVGKDRIDGDEVVIRQADGCQLDHRPESDETP